MWAVSAHGADGGALTRCARVRSAAEAGASTAATVTQCEAARICLDAIV
jgi:hypothetical protein